MTDHKPVAVDDGGDWTTANKAMRDAAKWTVATLGALGVGLFGAAPAIRGWHLSWTDPSDAVQLTFACLFALFGLTGMVGLIVITAQTLMPVIVSFANLSKLTIETVEADGSGSLPDGIATVAELRKELEDPDNNLAFAEEQLAAAKAAKNEENIKRLESYISAVNARRAVLEDSAARIIRLEGYLRIRDSFLRPYGHGWILWALLIAAVVGTLGFTFALAKGPASSSTSADVGFLTVGSDATASKTLWNALNLKACTVGGTVPVLVTDVKGDRSTVETIPTAGCVAQTFEVIPETANLAIVTPQTTTITYLPTPSPTG